MLCLSCARCPKVRQTLELLPGLNRYSRINYNTSVIVIHEIDMGIRMVSRRDPGFADDLNTWLHTVVLGQIFTDNHVLSVTTQVALNVGGLVYPTTKPFLDSLVAATARVNRMTLVTRNIKDFARDQIRVINPWND